MWVTISHLSARPQSPGVTICSLQQHIFLQGRKAIRQRVYMFTSLPHNMSMETKTIDKQLLSVGITICGLLQNTFLQGRKAVRQRVYIFTSQPHNIACKPIDKCSHDQTSLKELQYVAHNITSFCKAAKPSDNEFTFSHPSHTHGKKTN